MNDRTELARSMGERIQQRRTELGLSRTKLAKLARSSRYHLGRYESGAGCPGSPALVALCQALGVSADWLLGIVK